MSKKTNKKKVISKDPMLEPRRPKDKIVSKKDIIQELKTKLHSLHTEKLQKIEEYDQKINHIVQQITSLKS